MNNLQWFEKNSKTETIFQIIKIRNLVLISIKVRKESQN